MQINCYASFGIKEKLQSFKYNANLLGPYDVEVQISHCGVCHSDLHLIDNDWKNSQYPMVPGHEIIGNIKRIGNSVNDLSIGQRVGIGWLSDSCGQCEWCLKGKENLCKEQLPTCIGRFGGFSESVIVNHRFVFDIPKSLSSENAAPLLCGGITVYSALKENITQSDMQIGIIGIGGLGHLALQFARALGCKITAFTSIQKKQEDAIKFGADNVISSVDNHALSGVKNTFDFILSTVTENLNWSEFISALRPFGKLCIVGVPSLELSMPTLELIAGKKTVCGSNIGSCIEIKEMLNFAALHNIGAQVEVMEMKDCNMALDKIRKNNAYYRMVLTNKL